MGDDDAPSGSPGDVLSYDTGNRWLHILFVLAGWACVVFVATHSDPPRDVPLPLLMVTLFSYWLLFGVGYKLEVGSGRLFWYTLLRSGQVEMSEVRAIRASGNQVKVETATTRPARVWVSKGLFAFTEAVKEEYPHVTIRLDRGARLQERMPGRSAFRRRERQ